MCGSQMQIVTRAQIQLNADWHATVQTPERFVERDSRFGKQAAWVFFKSGLRLTM